MEGLHGSVCPQPRSNADLAERPSPMRIGSGPPSVMMNAVGRTRHDPRPAEGGVLQGLRLCRSDYARCPAGIAGSEPLQGRVHRIRGVGPFSRRKWFRTASGGGVKMVLVPSWTILVFEDHIRRHSHPCEYCERSEWLRAGRPQSEAMKVLARRVGVASPKSWRGFVAFMRRKGVLDGH